LTQGLLESFFLESSAGRIFIVLHRAVDSDRCAVFVPPFAEEMNKCRSQTAATARLLAASGCSALIVDLYGTGDSEGDFSDASWPVWTQDVALAVNWATDNGLIVDAMVATRLGCSLAVESFAEADLCVSKTVFWQPVESGDDHMNQFLRYGIAASMMKSKSGGKIGDLKQHLDKGDTLEIAGYLLAPTLWSEIQQVRLLDKLGPFLGELQILEVGRTAGRELSPSSTYIESAANERGLPTKLLRLRGEPYWASAEIVVNAELCRATVQAIVGRQ